MSPESTFANVAGLLNVPVGQLADITPEQRLYLIESFLMVADPDLGKLVPLVPNAMQREVLSTLGDREVTVKWRRAGLSSAYIGAVWIDLITVPGLNVELFAHNDRTAKDIFADIVLRQYEAIPEPFRPIADRSTVNSLIFHDIGSKFVVRTAGQSQRTAEAQGQARTIHRLILTEFAYYAYAESLYAKLINCVPQVGGKVFIDSTPNGMNSFHSRFAKARSGASEYKGRFFPWYWSERCALELDPGEEEGNIYGHGPITDEEQGLGDGNPFADARRGPGRLTPEQIKWRRWKLSDIEPMGNLTSVDRFRVEFPEDESSCFLHSGRPVFMPSVLVARGKLRDAIPGHEHVIGQDTSTGSATGHPAGIVVLDITTTPAEQVYEWAGHEPTDMQAERVVALQRQYPGLIVVERNFPGEAILQLLRRWEIDDVYLHRDAEIKEGMGRVVTRKPGFPTTAITKPRVFTDLSTSLSRGELVLSGPITISDLKGMQYNDKDLIEFLGDPGAAGTRGALSHGELAIAVALAWHGRKSSSMPIA